jgi:hypothetical protein
VLAQKLLSINSLAQRKLLVRLELLAPLAQVLQAQSTKIYPQWVVALV